MLSFAGQIQRASDKAKGGIARLTGVDAVSLTIDAPRDVELALSAPRESFED